MTRSARISAIILLAAATGAAQAYPARAAPAFYQRVYQYEIEDSTYGNLGTYTNIVTHDGDRVEVRTVVNAVVRILGIPFFRESAQRLEQWQNGRLVAFRSNTDDNGTKIDVTGKAQGDHFVIDAPTGVITAPARVHPSNPWAAQNFSTDTMMSTKTGEVVKVKVTDCGEKTVTFNGKAMRLHQYFIDGTKHQVVWLNDKGVVVAFQTPEHGAAINFVLKDAPHAPPMQQAFE